MHKLGVLSSTSLDFEDGLGSRSVPAHLQHLTGHMSVPWLLALADTWRITQLWIHPSYIAEYGYPVTDLLAEEDWNIQPKPAEDVRWYHAFRPHVRGDGVDLVFPHLDDRAAWRSCETGDELLSALQTFNGALGYPYRRSPGTTGTGLLRSLLGLSDDRGVITSTVRPPTIVAPPTYLSPSAGRDLSWIRPLTEEERGYTYLHSFDKNAQYLGAAASVELGMGDWSQVTPDEMPEGPLQTPPGYYHVIETYQAADYNLVSILNPDGRQPWQTELGWVMQPALTAARRAGYQVIWDAAYVWLHSRRALAQWQHRLRDARSQLQQSPDRAALDTLKMVYSQTVAWFDLTEWREEPAKHALYRPDWRHAVIAQAAANLWSQCVRAVNNGVHVVAIAHHDRVYVVSDDPSAAAVAEAAGLTLGTAVGQWKIIRQAVPLAPLCEIFAGAIGYGGRTMALSQLDRAVARHGESKVSNGSRDSVTAQSGRSAHA